MSARHTRRGFLAAHKLATKAGIRVPRGVAAGATAEQPQDGAEQGKDRPWYSVTNATADEAELMLYDDIGGWYGTFAEDFDADLKAITAPKLTVRLNSPGGSVFEGMAIASMLRSHPADITVRVDGIAASIASVIAMAGDRVVMMPGSTIMIHDASGVCLGDAAEMAKMAELLDLLSDNIADIYAAKAGGTRDEWRERMRAESWYLAQEAVDAGLADEVAPARGAGDEAPEMRQAWDLTAYGYAGREVTAKADDDKTSLTINIGSAIGQQIIDALRNAVRPEPAAPEQPVEPVAEAPAEEPTAAAEPLPEPEPQHDRARDDLTWADLTAHLTQPEPDHWAQLVANLTHPASRSAAADALKEAQ